MQVTGIQGAEEKPPGARCGAADIGMNTAIPADMGQNNPMTHLHTVHLLGQRKIIHMNLGSVKILSQIHFIRQ